MKKEENMIEFDLSNLSLQELIKVYNDIEEFITYLKGKKIVLDEVDNG